MKCYIITRYIIAHRPRLPCPAAALFWIDDHRRQPLAVRNRAARERGGCGGGSGQICQRSAGHPARATSIRRRGRSPGSRISAFDRLPSARTPVTWGSKAHRSQLRGQLRIGRERRTGFPLSFGSLRRPRQASTYMARLWRQATKHRPSHRRQHQFLGQRQGLSFKKNETCGRIRLPAAVREAAR